MALVIPQPDDIVVFDRSGPDVRGGIVTAFEVEGARRLSLDEALELGHVEAKRRGVALWLEDGAEHRLIANYRPSRS